MRFPMCLYPGAYGGIDKWSSAGQSGISVVRLFVGVV